MNGKTWGKDSARSSLAGQVRSVNQLSYDHAFKLVGQTEQLDKRPGLLKAEGVVVSQTGTSLMPAVDNETVVPESPGAALPSRPLPPNNGRLPPYKPSH